MIIDRAPAVALVLDRILHPPCFYNVESMPGVTFPLSIPSGHAVWHERLSRPGGHETALCHWFQQHLIESDVLYDVGAGWGFFSALATALQPTVSCHLFDPGPRQCAYLKRNRRLVPDRKRWTIHAGPVGANHTRRCLSLDHYAVSTGQWPTIIKIDVDGVEGDVIRGATLLIDKRVTQFLIELHPRPLGARGQSISTILEAFPNDYRISALIDIRSGKASWTDDLTCLPNDDNPYIHAASRDTFRVTL